MAMKHAWVPNNDAQLQRDGHVLNLEYDVWEQDKTTLAAYLVSPTTYGTYIEDAYDHLAANLPSSVGSLLFESASLQETSDDNGRLTFRVRYTSFRNQRRWGHDTTGGTLHITNSYATAIYNRTGFTGINYGGLIGMTEDGPEGVDRVIPALRRNCRFRHPPGGILSTENDYLDYTKTLAAMTGTTNNDEFFGHAAGELLFMGSTGDFNLGYENEFDYVFLASANATGLTIAQAISGVAKEGHDYLWLEFRGGKNDDDKWVPTIPVAVHVERIYEKTDFTQLGIGF